MNNHINNRYDALALFSGGLDSILAARLVQEQGLRVLGLHFVSPFFGKPEKINAWEKTYGVPVIAVDISKSFTEMLCQGPVHGLGKVLNPCVDCKILMLSRARDMLDSFGARFIVSGEVVGQRPMSQRLDALNIIKRDSEVKDILVRALSARRLPPSRPEITGLVDREKLGDISGRGRKQQLELARRFNIDPVPTPAGGCLLTEKESAKRYLPLFRHKIQPCPEDFYLANTGRQLWHEDHWLCIGRNRDDNARLRELAGKDDYLFKLRNFPGPLGLGRPVNRAWSRDVTAGACRQVASFSPRARQTVRPVEVVVEQGNSFSQVMVLEKGQGHEIKWQEPQWNRDEARILDRVQQQRST